MLKKLKNFFLNQSDSYIYYKENYYKLVDINKKNEFRIKELEKNLKIKEKKIEEFTNEISKTRESIELLEKKLYHNKLTSEQKSDELIMLFSSKFDEK